MALARRLIKFVGSNAVEPKSPIGKYLRRFAAMKIDPYKVRMGVGRDYEFDSLRVSFNLVPKDNHTVILQSLKAKYPGTSEGSAALTTLCSIADRYKVTILLDASPYDTDMPRDKLISWYQRFGFKITEHSEMQRLPK
jgi:hypothetical protein